MFGIIIICGNCYIYDKGMWFPLVIVLYVLNCPSFWTLFER